MTTTDNYILENAILILPDRVVEQGWIAISEGRIAEIGEGRAPERGFDVGGDYLLPGLIELHTDHIESHFIPRPHVRWHALSAVMAYDAQIASAGITTVFDSLRVGSDFDLASLDNDDLWQLSEALAAAKASGHLRAEHRTHLRCEISSSDVLEQAEGYAARYPVHLMSLMDHTPGQRQFRDISIWKTYYMGKSDASDEEASKLIAWRLDLHERNAVRHRQALVEFAREHGAVLASHDDGTKEHVAQAVADGVAVAEFPTTMEAAQASHAAGIQVMMGGPNVVRGGSHSGNIAAETLAREGILDLLSSDYVPASLLMAAFDLPRRVPEISLPKALATVTANPARAAGLADRGTLEAGLRADIVRAHISGDVPVVREVWREGRRVA
ncbi:alpha-D-ribose 1-methylphosphonate 5-triphosphate diphosphatase [Pseudochelatococcus lubricantis]|uniref:Alpha-D-ribose 1-methylphosphonate 5-triphosphate diphosphatase n=1 Tax=Pseudochelatococcus lubricantis TaxID=1538102 RepID=A0ABX0V3W3_9HYPH|nr:alpha-D-ribose 1-methylphosphonate 5-triphosphate diphosphatase [Pseudochelatococcus lubricantis]NIJ58495.1 alpha-D-ribose 1-methylphosphonate 5-triphosphate diphosphatase [Pseudochelatococcus lubricantis]